MSIYQNMKQHKILLNKVLNYFYICFILEISLTLLFIISIIYLNLGLFYYITVGAMVIMLFFLTLILLKTTTKNITVIDDYLTEYLVIKNKNS